MSRAGPGTPGGFPPVAPHRDHARIKPRQRFEPPPATPTARILAARAEARSAIVAMPPLEALRPPTPPAAGYPRGVMGWFALYAVGYMALGVAGLALSVYWVYSTVPRTPASSPDAEDEVCSSQLRSFFDVATAVFAIAILPMLYSVVAWSSVLHVGPSLSGGFAAPAGKVGLATIVVGAAAVGLAVAGVVHGFNKASVRRRPTAHSSLLQSPWASLLSPSFTLESCTR
ncbi:uncharacterized protein AMSG_04890 [Thecamonas trahens ATCC 50062]|uniref:Transmembrane protein n=1 Tax=Thecamonas trahens ATCC 50062 TaxID=461836 RepID=A0A0L0D7W7_THETB|nr:hypothetical protein AMSG_04890 [Thecamonas trahens ATCC 50062]KNC48444.1 hypothetical protein AMSG_04890 [Thecamonas trahens ATCC 50062]|eukprot:XP_013758557.1 hypothetical protein AMSG_04890 [Thecamonas trahens ATCC 50062]